MNNIFIKLFTLSTVVPSIVLSSIVTQQCKTYWCFEEFEKRTGITDYDAKIDKDGTYSFQYDTNDINKSKKQVKVIEKKQQKVLKPKKVKVFDEYTIALQKYKNEEYNQSYNKFKALFEKDLNNININYYLGRSAYKLEKYDEAILAYDRVLFEKPNSSRVKLELAKSYLKQEEYKEAKKYLLEIKEDITVSKLVKKRVDRLLEIIDSKTQKSFINGALLIGVNYDTNINSDPENYQLNGISSEETAAWAHQEVAIINHKYIMDERKIIKNDLMLYNKGMFNNKYSDKNIQMLSYNPMINIAYEDGITVDYGVFVDALRLDSKYTLQTWGILPKLNYSYSKNSIFDFYLKIQDKNYQKSLDKTKNSKYYELSAANKYILNEKSILGTNLIYARERKDKTGRFDVDKNQLGLKLNLSYLLNKQFTFVPSLGYKQVNYLEKDLSKTKNRKDKQTKLSLVGTYVYDANWVMQGMIDSLKNNSTYDENTYNKNTLTINVIRPF
jgi:tetratricopeptide (TPR) repeat protein